MSPVRIRPRSGSASLRKVLNIIEDARPSVSVHPPLSLSPSPILSLMKQTGTVRKPYTGQKKAIVIALDVGTTFSGVSYALLDPGEIPKIYEVTRSVLLVSSPPHFPITLSDASRPSSPSPSFLDFPSESEHVG
jgi:hypothetical protein